MSSRHLSFCLPQQRHPAAHPKRAKDDADDEPADSPHLHHHFVEMPPAPSLPRRGLSMACVGLTGCLCFLLVVTLQIWLLQIDMLSVSQIHAHVRRHGTGEGTRDAVSMGLWDEQAHITPMQLCVSLSMALRVDERHVEVVPEQNHFFTVRIFEDLDSIMDLASQSGFQQLLNTHTQMFGGTMIVSRVPTIFYANTTR